MLKPAPETEYYNLMDGQTDGQIWYINIVRRYTD